MNTQKEVWKPVYNHEGIYEVSNLGRVKSLERKVNHRYGERLVSERILKPYIGNTGYAEVGIRDGSGVKRNRTIHQLVAEAFLGHRPDGTNFKVVDHRNDIKTDNRLENLRIIKNRPNSDKSHIPSEVDSVGVTIDHRTGRYRAQIQIEGNPVYLGTYRTEEQAAKAYRKAVNNLDKYKGDNKDFRKDIGEYKEIEKTSKYEGVYWSTKKERWICQARIGGKQRNLGVFKTEDEAYKAYITAMDNIHLFRGDITAFKIRVGLKKKPKSSHKGVGWDKSRKKWIAQITVNYKHKLIGRFDTEEEAVKARLEYEKLLC